MESVLVGENSLVSSKSDVGTPHLEVVCKNCSQLIALLHLLATAVSVPSTATLLW